MLDLKKRILDEKSGPAANNLAFEVQCYAMGLFVEKSSPECKLPEDLLKYILLFRVNYFCISMTTMIADYSHLILEGFSCSLLPLPFLLWGV